MSERNLADLLLLSEENAPAVIRHLHIIEFCPALRIDRHCRAQIDERLLKALRPHRLPPIEVAGMPALERAQHRAILGQTDIVRNLRAVINIDDIHGSSPHTLVVSKAGFWPVP